MLKIRLARPEDAALLNQMANASYRHHFAHLWHNADEMEHYLQQEYSMAALAHSHPDGLHPPDGAELTASDIARHLRDWFNERTGAEPVDSQLREYGARFLDALDAIKLKAANNPERQN